MNPVEKPRGGGIDYVMDPYCPMLLESNLGGPLYKELEAARRKYLSNCIAAEIELLKKAQEILAKLEKKD